MEQTFSSPTLLTALGVASMALAILRQVFFGSTGLCPVPARRLRHPRTDSRGRT